MKEMLEEVMALQRAVVAEVRIHALPVKTSRVMGMPVAVVPTHLPQNVTRINMADVENPVLTEVPNVMANLTQPATIVRSRTILFV